MSGVYLGWEKVSRLERCPQFMGVFIEEAHTIANIMCALCVCLCVSSAVPTLG